MLLVRRYRTLEFEDLKPSPPNGLIIYAVRIVKKKLITLPSKGLGVWLFHLHSLPDLMQICHP